MSSEGFEMWSLHLESYPPYPPDMENVTLCCRDKAFQQRYIHILYIYTNTHTHHSIIYTFTVTNSMSPFLKRFCSSNVGEKHK